MNFYYVKSLLTIKKITLQSYIDPPAKIDWSLILLFYPDFSIIFGNFNVRSNKWWVGDTQTSEGSQIDSLTASYGFR